MAFEELQQLEQLAADVSPLERGLLQQARQDRLEAAAEEREQGAREANRQARLEATALVNKQLGDPLGELSRAQAAAGMARDEVADLEGKLAKAKAKLSRAEDNVQFFATRMQQVTESVSRSAPDEHDLLAGAKETLARMRVEAMLKAPLKPAPLALGLRPFASRSAGAAVRSEPVTCPDCLAMGATEAESFAIHHPELLPESTVQPEQAGRHRAAHAPEITRVATADGSGQLGDYFGNVVR
jgi:hypothetical protein